MEVKNFTRYNIDEQFGTSITAASELFHAGKIFIYPTDTIYGLGGNPFNEYSVKRINDIKGRDTAKQFIWLVSNMDILVNYVEMKNEKKLDFLKKIYPAPVSVVLNLNFKTKNFVGFNSAAFRIPDNLFCNKILEEIGSPLISTSVNRTGGIALNDYTEIEQEFSEEVDALFYSQIQNNAVASTIIDLRDEKPALIREGAIKFVELLDKFK